MANSLYNQLNQTNPSLQNDVVNMMRAVTTASNPQQMLLNLATQNNQLASVLNEVAQSGGDAKTLFFQKAGRMGVEPNSILSQLR